MNQLLKRREFLKKMIAGTISSPLLLDSLTQAIQAQPSYQKKELIWLRGLNSSIHEQGYWNIPEFYAFFHKFFSLLQMSELKSSRKDKKKKQIVLIEGLLAQDDDKLKNAKTIIANARVVLLVGNEACYGNDKNWVTIDQDILLPSGTPFIKLPGMPASARHILGTLNHLVLFGIPELDVEHRPMMFFNKSICERCEYRSNYETGDFLTYFGEKEGCLYLLGCKGPVVKNTCPVDHWNETNQWCVSVGSPCTGCSDSSYPEHAGLGLYGQISSEVAGVNSKIVRYAENAIKATVAATASGILIHAVTRKGTPPVEIQMDQKYRDED